MNHFVVATNLPYQHSFSKHLQYMKNEMYVWGKSARSIENTSVIAMYGINHLRHAKHEYVSNLPEADANDADVPSEEPTTLPTTTMSPSEKPSVAPS